MNSTPDANRLVNTAEPSAQILTAVASKQHFDAVSVASNHSGDHDSEALVETYPPRPTTSIHPLTGTTMSPGNWRLESHSTQ